MTQGCIEAFQAAGRELVPMTGEDNNGFLKIWKRLIDEGDPGFKGISASEPTWMSRIALDTMLDVLAGKPVLKYNFIPVHTITETDIDEYVRMDYSDAYWCNSRLPEEVAEKYYLETE